MRVERISINRIRPSPLNSRIAPNSDDLDSLVASIKRMGLIQPIKVRPVEDNYEIVTGERRFNALIKAGILYVEAIVEEMTDEEVLREQWDENNERQDLSDYERALALKKMLEVYRCTQAKLAERMGNNQSWVSRHLAILKLEEFMPIGIIRELNESQARVILQAPQEDWTSLRQFIERYFEEGGKVPAASAIEEYARELALTNEIEKNSQHFLYEIEGKSTEEPVEAEDSVEEMDGRDLRPLLKEPHASPAMDSKVVASINRMVGEPVEVLQEKLMEEYGLNEVEADTALEEFRETYPGIWLSCYPTKSGEEAEALEEPMSAGEFVADVLMHNPEVEPAELVKVTAEMFGVSAEYVQGLINRRGKRGRKRQDPYAPRSPRTMCPLCGRQNAEMNKLLMVLEAYQGQPGITLVDWLKEVLT